MENSNNDLKITIIETNEQLIAYPLHDGRYHDSNCIGANQPPTSKTGKKIFKKSEIRFGWDSNN